MKKKIKSAYIEKMEYEFDETDIRNALTRVHGFPVGWFTEWLFELDDNNQVRVTLICSRTKDEVERQETI